MSTQKQGPAHAGATSAGRRRGRSILAAAAATMVALSGLSGAALAEEAEPTESATPAVVDAQTTSEPAAEGTPASTPDTTDSASASSAPAPEEQDATGSAGDAASTAATPSVPTTGVDGDSGTSTTVPGTSAPEGSVAASETVTPLVAGPEPGISAPYLYWEAKSGTGALLGGTTFTLVGPKTGNKNTGSNAWTNMPSLTVVDNGSYDLDPDDGEFLVKYRGANSTNAVAAGTNYRVQATNGPSGYTAPSGWTYVNTMNNNNASATWNNGQGNGTHDFGDFTFTSLNRSHTINVNKGELRTGVTGDTNVNIASTYTVGARFGLYTSLTATDPIMTCEITTANQPCSFTGVNASGVLYVGELPAVPGTLADTHYSTPITTLTTGTSSGFTDRSYRYATSSLSASTNQTVTVPSAPSSADTWDSSSGRFVNVVKNPELVLQCDAGIDIALVVDLSASVYDARATLRDAALNFVDSLKGTGSRVALKSFGDISPRASTSNTDLLSVDTQQAVLNNTIQSYYQAVTNQGSNGQGTNWDAGLWAAAQQAESYDLVIVLTDGNPTYSAINNSGTAQASGSGSLTTFRELERAIASANVIKNKDARIITFGIGAAGAVSNHNLASISGPDGWAEGDASLNDFDYINASWSALTALLEDFASAIACEANVDVTKLVAPLQGQTVAANGWEFSLSKEGDGAVAPTASQTTAGTGANTGKANWTVEFDNPGDSLSSITLRETVKDGYALDTVSCTVNNQPVASTIGEDGRSVTLSGITVGIGGETSCTFTNKELPKSATVTWNKVDGDNNNALLADSAWTIVGPGFPESGALVADWAGEGSYTGLDKDPVAGQFKLDGLAVGTYTVTESTVPTGYTGPSSSTFDITTADAGKTVALGNKVNKRILGAIEVTKTDATNQATLSGAVFQLWNDVNSSGTLDDRDTKIGDTITTPDTGIAAWTDLEWGDYLVQEVTPPTGYSLSDPSVQAFEVTRTTVDTTLTYTFANSRKPGSVAWAKVDASNTPVALSGSEWKLTGPDGSTSMALSEATCTGAPTPATGDPYCTYTATGQFSVANLPWGDYDLVETKAPAGYVLGSKPHEFTISGTGLTVSLGQIVNVQATPPSLPLTGGLGTDTFLLVGGGLLALAGLGGWIHRRRAHRLA